MHKATARCCSLLLTTTTFECSLLYGNCSLMQGNCSLLPPSSAHYYHLRVLTSAWKLLTTARQLLTAAHYCSLLPPCRSAHFCMETAHYCKATAHYYHLRVLTTTTFECSLLLETAHHCKAYCSLLHPPSNTNACQTAYNQIKCLTRKHLMQPTLLLQS